MSANIAAAVSSGSAEALGTHGWTWLGKELPPVGQRHQPASAAPAVGAPAIPKSPTVSAGTTVKGAVAKRELDELVKRAQAGDPKAFAELFRKHRSSVAAIAFRMLGPSADLDDVVQDVFLQVHRSLPDFRGQAKFSTWLHRVAVNVVLMTRRRARSRPSYAKEEAGRHEPDDHPLPDQDVARHRRLTAFRKLLDRLSEKKRTVFVLHELEGMAPAKIAELVDCPVLTVRTRLFYARRELAEMMRTEPTLMTLVATKESEATSQASPKGKGRRSSQRQSNPSSRDGSGEVTRPAPGKGVRSKKGGKS